MDTHSLEFGIGGGEREIHIEMRINIKNVSEEVNILDGKFHYLGGINFYFAKRDFRISFYVSDVFYRKHKKIRVDMFHEPNHNRPHVHIGNHDASFAINDGSLLAGQCDTKAEKVMKEWIAKNKDTLLKMWKVLQNGLPEDYINILKESLNSNEIR